MDLRPGAKSGDEDFDNFDKRRPVLFTKFDEICNIPVAILVFVAITAFRAFNFVFNMLATTVDVAFKNIVEAFASFPPKKWLRSMVDNLSVVFRANVKASDIAFTKCVVRFTPFDI